ncbi:hypothetical protein D3C85_723530 [compost metagenome]
MKVVTAWITPPRISPISGTMKGVRSGTRRSSARNSKVPASAKPVAVSILPITGVSGASSVTARMPSVADSTVPAVVGST